jgi:ABC-2 type transport system permease protein
VNGFVGIDRLIRLILRQERTKLTAWIVVLGVLPVFTAQTFLELYPTEEARQGLAATIGANPAFSAFLGPLQGTSIGAITSWRLLIINGALIGIMAVLTMIRHTRVEEETGRRELLGSTVVGRHASLAAAVAVTTGAALLAGIIQTAGLVGVGLEWGGSAAFGLATVGMGIFFVGVAAVAAQLSPSSGTTRGIGLAVLGALFLIRVGADSTGIDGLSWVTPFGWLVELAPFAGESWWVVGAWVGAFVVLSTVALSLASRRDVGAGILASRAGEARAGRTLSGVFGLAWRQHRAGLLGWTIGVSLIGFVYGAFAEGIGDMIADNPQMAAILALLGGERGITDAFFMAAVGIIAIIVSGYAVRTVLRLQDEETLLRSEYVLSTPATRTGLAGSHLIFAFVGPAVMLAVAGALAGLVYGVAIGDPIGEAARVTAAALVQVPAVWVVAGAAMALYGALPRFTSVAWGVLVACLLLGQLGPILRLPQWAMNASPFTHVPAFPVESLNPVPLVGLAAVAVGLLLVGMNRFRTRDIPAV